MTRIVVIGGLNMDLHLFDLAEAVSQAPLLAERHLAEPGGKGANVARAAARLGADVALVGRIGDDDHGRNCVTAVADDGVDTGAVVVTPGESTGFVAIELKEGRHHSVLFAPGANDRVTWSDIGPTVELLDPGDIVIAQAELPREAMSDLAAFATRSGIVLFLDPTPTDRCTAELLAAAEVITPNRVEAAALVGRVDSSPVAPALAATDLLRSGAQRVLVKTGESGALLAEGDSMSQIPTLAITPTDEIGAGDVFLAALAVRRSEGGSWEKATRFANTASALSVAASGLVLPDRQAVDQAMKQLVAPTRRIL